MMDNPNENSPTPLRGFAPAGVLPAAHQTTAAPSAPAPTRSRKQAADEFTGSLTSLQVRIPSDLVLSIKLQSFESGKSMSEIVLEALTSDATIAKSWVSSRRSAG
jgi:hypothetical protein